MCQRDVNNRRFYWQPFTRTRVCGGERDGQKKTRARQHSIDLLMVAETVYDNVDRVSNCHSGRFVCIRLL